MNGKKWWILACALVALVVASPFLWGADRGQPGPANTQRLVIKVCNWDGVVPEKALDGFALPKGKWVDYQKQGWRVESYIVAPTAPGSANGFYAVLAK
jgi:hypothetical protein